jgi:site-specific DNA recombinase
VVYVRVSTEDQARHGYSLEAQEEACRRKALELGAARAEVYRDEGVTGEVLERPGLQAALAAAKAGAKWFVVYDPDRLSRKLAHQLLLAEQIERAGCRLEFVTMDWQDTPEGRLFYSLRGAIAEYEKEKFKARSRMGKLAKARRGLLTHDPRLYGYRYVPGEGRLEIDEAEAAVYRRMAEMALAGASPEAIADRLNAEGVPCPRGSKWYRATVRRILKNPAYAGTMWLNRWCSEGRKAARQRGQKAAQRLRPREDWVPVSIPALISREAWEALQRSLAGMKKGRRGGRVRSYPLSGLLRCGLCGAPMWGFRGGRSNSKGYRYYVCSCAWPRGNKDRREPRPACPSGCHRADALEEAVWSRVRAWLEDPEALARDARQEGAAEAAEAEAASLKRRLAQVERERERAFEAYRRGLVDLGLFEDAMGRLGAEKAALEARLAGLEEAKKAAALVEQGAEALRELAREIAGRLDELDWAERGRLIRLLVRRITVREGEIVAEARLAPEPPGRVVGTGTAACGAVSVSTSAEGPAVLVRVPVSH